MKPLIDIVVLVHDKSEWADLCVRSVEAFTKNPYRLIIVDSASKEAKTKTWFNEVKARGHTIVHLNENRSFSGGVNAGVLVGDARFICILNDDCVVTEGWDTALIQDATDKQVGLVGAQSNYASGAQGDPSFQGEPPYLVFVCVALRREVWNLLGPMDSETFDGFSSEDLDYAWRVKKAGLKLKVSSAYVLHAGSRTLAATQGAYQQQPDGSVVIVGDNAEARRRNDQKYNARLVEKWGKEWTKEHSSLVKRGVVTTYHPNEWTGVEFMKNLFGLKRCEVPFEYLQVTRAPIHLARQLAADFALDSGFDWWVQFDDDATFPNDVLRLLARHQKEVVTTLAYQRKPPHGACIFEIGEDGLMGGQLNGWENTGLRRVDVSGYHVSMMHTSVIKKLRDAGIRQYFGGFDNKVGEDFAFSLNLKKIGVPIYCDTDIDIGHVGANIVVDRAYKAAFDAGRK